MPLKTILEFLAETEGHCCVYGMLKDPKYSKLSNQALAEKLGVGRRTVGEARILEREGVIRCRGEKGCTKS